MLRNIRTSALPTLTAATALTLALSGWAPAEGTGAGTTAGLGSEPAALDATIVPAASTAPAAPGCAPADVAPAPAPAPETAPHADEPAAGPSDRPTTSTTGVRPGVSLTKQSVKVVRQDGTVLDGALIRGDVLISADDVTLRDVRVEGELRITGDRARLSDSDIGALKVSGAKDVRAARLNIFGEPGSDGIHVTSDRGRAQDVMIEDSLIHSPAVTRSSHYDGIQVRGVDRLTLRGNSFELGPHKPQFTAAVFVQDANGGNADVTITDNWIDGGGYAMYLDDTDDLDVSGNRFGAHARWGLLYPGSDTRSAVVERNVWDATNQPADL